MKTVAIALLIIITILASCGVTRNTGAKDEKVESTQIEQDDSLEYQLIIFDPDFDIWLARNAHQQSYYSQDYLEYWNHSLALQWNSFSGGSARNDCRPTTHIDYDSSVDYGKEINYRLFYYFMYVDEQCRIFNNRPGDWRR